MLCKGISGIKIVIVIIITYDNKIGLKLNICIIIVYRNV